MALSYFSINALYLFILIGPLIVIGIQMFCRIGNPCAETFRC